MGGGAADFLNAVVEADTLLKPLELLDACLETEHRLGRTRAGEGWVPRTIDLDLLYFEKVTIQSERLTLPHPRIAERDFVAVPLSDLTPDLEIMGGTISQLVRQLRENQLFQTPYKLLASAS
jgi:2-amino-4-hydroxy-6-hydroxymethyldihydropteridine diphosphokinase